MIENTNQKSRDYSHIKDSYRPSHADYTYDKKYGIRDYRGGGRSSARETACRVVAGAIAQLLLREIGVEIYSCRDEIFFGGETRTSRRSCLGLPYLVAMID